MEGRFSLKNTAQASPITSQKVASSRPMSKSKTSAELPRPLSGKPKDFYNISRIMPNKIKEDKEMLFAENLRLKVHSNGIIEENILLKSKIKQLENRKKKYEKKDPTLSLISNLKAKNKELSERLLEKEEHISYLKKNLKTCVIEEYEIQIVSLEEECKRLASHLSEFMKQKDIPNSHLEYETKLFNKGKIISKFKKEIVSLQSDLFTAKEEIHSLKEKISQIEKKNRKHSPKTVELAELKEEIEQLREANHKGQIDHLKKEETLKHEIRALREQMEKEIQKTKNLEKDLTENEVKVSTLQKQMSFLKSETMKSPEVYIPKALIPSEEKVKHPPRLFVKIWEVAKNKNMLISVFLSIIDKNNNGVIEADELRRGISLHGKLIKKKHIDDVLKLMHNETNFFQVEALEQLIEKYEFDDDYFSSSEEEEIIEPVKPRPERLKYNAVRPDPKMNEVVVPQSYPAPPKFKEPEVSLVSPDQLSEVFERIRLQMVERMIGKNRCVNVIFANYLDPEQMVSVKEVKDYIYAGGLFLGTDEDALNFSKFLIEPDGVETVKESEYKGLRSKINEFSKKLDKYLGDWETLDRYKQHMAVYQTLLDNKEEVLQELGGRGEVETEEFYEVLKKFCDIDRRGLMYLYQSSFYLSKKVFCIDLDLMLEELANVQRKIEQLVIKNSKSLKNIQEKLKKNNLNFDDVFGYRKDILVNFETFSLSIKSLEMPLDEELVSDIRFGKYNCHLGLMKALLQSLPK